MGANQQEPLSGENKPPRLLDLVRDAIRRKHYSYRTEQAYVHWIKRFIFFTGKRPARLPAVLTRAEARRILANLHGMR